MDASETSHKQDNLHTCDNTPAGVNTALRFLITALESSSLFVLLFMVFSRPKLYCAELSLTIGCHGDARQLGLMACKKSLAQVKSKELFIYPALLSLSSPLSDLVLPVLR